MVPSEKCGGSSFAPAILRDSERKPGLSTAGSRTGVGR
ncbi:MAG: hypothetical protein ACD_75C00089G0001, partial [uncultured bacterium]